MKKWFLCLLLVSLVGCAKNEIKLENSGTSPWQHLEIRAGGHVFEIDQFEGGATERFRFSSRAEDGGLFRGSLNGQEFKAQFGYFTPNLASQLEIVLSDDGTIMVQEGP